jgi:hypothetical protein
MGTVASCDDPPEPTASDDALRHVDHCMPTWTSETLAEGRVDVSLFLTHIGCYASRISDKVDGLVTTAAAMTQSLQTATRRLQATGALHMLPCVRQAIKAGVADHTQYCQDEHGKSRCGQRLHRLKHIDECLAVLERTRADLIVTVDGLVTEQHEYIVKLLSLYVVLAWTVTQQIDDVAGEYDSDCVAQASTPPSRQ